MTKKGEENGGFLGFFLILCMKEGERCNFTYITKKVYENYDLGSDREGEYFSSEFSKFSEKNVIVHQTSVAYTPQRNGLAEI